jgi:hypothetical protein
MELMGELMTCDGRSCDYHVTAQFRVLGTPQEDKNEIRNEEN